MNWQRDLKLRHNYPLKNKTSFKIGGKAKFFAEAGSAQELRALLKEADAMGIPVFILGAGSNLLVSDKGVKGLVIKLGAPFFNVLSKSGASIYTGSAVALSALARFCAQNRLSGAEFLAGIPGSVGGALMMNAGCWGKSIASLVKRVEVMDYRGRVKEIPAGLARFGYRRSGLGKFIILGAYLGLKRGERSKINCDMRNYALKRRLSQGLAFPNAGCIFKNPPSFPAGKLIDLCGLKGKSCGAAYISDKHANFILNKGRARACDVLKLMRLIKRRVKDRFGLELVEEIKLWQ
jgi:UDP-N-acetylmuramate dehydrogenase